MPESNPPLVQQPSFGLVHALPRFVNRFKEMGALKELVDSAMLICLPARVALMAVEGVAATMLAAAVKILVTWPAPATHRFKSESRLSICSSRQELQESGVVLAPEWLIPARY